MKDNKTCLVCGTKYTYCSSCSQYASLPLWMNHFHSENCKMIYNTVVGYDQKSITQEEAVSRLSKCNIENMDNPNESIRKILDKIYLCQSDVAVNEISTDCMSDKNDCAVDKEVSDNSNSDMQNTNVSTETVKKTVNRKKKK